MQDVKKPLVLVILDGWGIREAEAGNAIAQAKKPNWDNFLENYPHTKLKAFGEDVGLPEGQMGNSEVGHLNLGAGRVVYQELTRITKEIKDKTFNNNLELNKAVDHALANGSALHLMGLLSDGGVHSHINHLVALLELAKAKGLKKVYVHAFLDGRDVPPSNGKVYIEFMEKKFKELGIGQFATVMGRYYAMDRDKRWDRTELAYKAMVYGEGLKATLATAAVDRSYDLETTDEFIKPVVIIDREEKPIATVKDNDAVIFYNFRPDRARQITRAFVDHDFDGFSRRPGHPKVYYVCMTQYDATIKAPVAFPPQSLTNTLGQVLSSEGLKQLRIAETEKYAHVTFFFNGGVEEPSQGEERILIPSPKVATYDLKPEMSAFEVTDRVIDEINKEIFDVIIINYANTDMVGHTGIMDSAVQAVQAVDRCLGRLVEAVLEKEGRLLVTADHGNAEQILDEDGDPHTAHTLNDVPLVFISDDSEKFDLRQGKLEDVAPTMLYLLQIKQPEEMTGRNLLSK